MQVNEGSADYEQLVDSYFSKLNEPLKKRAESVREAKLPEDESPLFTRMPTSSELGKSGYNALLELYAGELDRQADLPASEASFEMALGSLPIGAIKKYEKVLGGNNPLEISGKKIGKILYETARPNEISTLINPSAAEIAIRQKSNLMGSILKDITDRDDPYQAARRLIKEKGIGTRIEQIDDLPDVSGSFSPGGNTIFVNKQSHPSGSNSDVLAGTLLHEIQHAEENKNYPELIKKLTGSVRHISRNEMSNNRIADYEMEQMLTTMKTGGDISNTRDKALFEYVNEELKNKGKKELTKEEFDPKRFGMIRNAYNLSPDIYMLDRYQNANHFIEPKGEIDLSVLQGAKHGLFPTKYVDVHPQWEELLKQYLDEQAKQRAGSFMDLGKKK